MPPSSPDAGAFAVDLDETLVRVNTFPLFTRFAVRQLLAQRELAAAGAVVLALVRRKLLGGSHAGFKAGVHRAGERVAPQALERWAAGVLERSGEPAVRDLVDAWEGTTVLTTSAPAVYAEVFGRLAGFTATHGSCFSGGEYVENLSEEKAVRLRERGEPVGRAVTDDPELDLPILRLAADPLVVERDGARAVVSPWRG